MIVYAMHCFTSGVFSPYLIPYTDSMEYGSNKIKALEKGLKHG